MTDTPRLGFPEIASGQSDKTVTHNDGLKRADILVQGWVQDKDLTAPPGGESDGQMWIVGSSATGAWATHDKALAYFRSSSWAFFPASGSPGAAHEGLTVWVRDENKHYTFDGSNWVISVSASLTIEDLSDTVFTGLAQGDILRRNGSSQWINEKPPVWIGTDRTSGAPGSSEVMLDRVIPAEIILPASMTGSVAEAGVAATAQTDFDVQKNGSSVATIRFAASGTTATFINAGADTFAAGDNLRVVAPASPDATLADIVITLVFTRS
jgi:hypothetical protein